MVSVSSAIPRSAKNSHSSGMITLSAAVSALMVSRPERRRAVDQDHVVAGPDLLQHPEQRLLAGHLRDQLHLGGRQVDVAGQDVQVLDPGRSITSSIVVSRLSSRL